MSTFDPGTGGSLVSTNYPAAFKETCVKLQLLEAAAAIDNIQITEDYDAGTTTIAAALPNTQSVNATTGAVEIVASDYLSGSAFTPGGGDLVSTNFPAAVLEMAQRMQLLESAAGIDNLQITHDSDAATSTIAATLPQTQAVNATTGIIEVTTTDYLP